jgi:hypothetical protein
MQHFNSIAGAYDLLRNASTRAEYDARCSASIKSWPSLTEKQSRELFSSVFSWSDLYEEAGAEPIPRFDAWERM